MKKVERKHPTPDEYVDGPIIFWHESIEKTLSLMWANLEVNYPRFYQKSFRFDRPLEHYSEYIRSFFEEKGVFAVCRNYTDPKVGDRSWLTILAMRERFSKYKPMVW